jgi:hypothetical protein
MSATVKKNQKPIHVQILDAFYRQNITAVKKVRDMVKDACNSSSQAGKNGKDSKPRKGSKLGEIKNLLKDDLFNGINWELTPVERESVNITDYVCTVGKPTTYELSDEEYSRICGEIAYCRIQGETSIYENTIVAGCIANFKDACKKTIPSMVSIHKKSQNSWMPK